MKKIIILLSLLLCGFAFAATETLNWYVDGQVYATTTCQTGGDIILPTAPTKYGYTFHGWLGYKPIEYLEAQTQYPTIDTGIPGGKKTYTIEAKLSYGKWKAYGMFYTNFKSNSHNTIQFMLYGTDANRCMALNEIQADQGIHYVPCAKNVPHILKDTYEKVVFDGTSYTKSSKTNGIENTKTIRLFGADIDEKIYYFKIYDNDVLVRDFIPVLDHNGSPCMYDKVSKQFFYNSGTGDFIAGPIINQ